MKKGSVKEIVLTIKEVKTLRKIIEEVDIAAFINYDNLEDPVRLVWNKIMGDNQ